MELFLDIGNSCCKYAVSDNGKITKYDTQNYGPFGKLYSLKSLGDQFSKAKRIIICSVLSEEMNAELEETLSKSGMSNIYFLKASVNSFGVSLAYADPSSFGADRLAALISVNEKYSGNSCIVDSGTAVTIDALDENGKHHGGVIMPGAEIMKNGLLANTKIKVESAEPEFNVLSSTTENAIYSGCVSAIVGGVEYVADNMAMINADFKQIILTGGGAEELSVRMSESFRSKICIDSTVVLDGLQVVSQNL